MSCDAGDFALSRRPCSVPCQSGEQPAVSTAQNSTASGSRHAEPWNFEGVLLMPAASRVTDQLLLRMLCEVLIKLADGNN